MDSLGRRIQMEKSRNRLIVSAVSFVLICFCLLPPHFSVSAFNRRENLVSTFYNAPRTSELTSHKTAGVVFGWPHGYLGGEIRIPTEAGIAPTTNVNLIRAFTQTWFADFYFAPPAFVADLVVFISHVFGLSIVVNALLKRTFSLRAILGLMFLVAISLTLINYQPSSTIAYNGGRRSMDGSVIVSFGSWPGD